MNKNYSQKLNTVDYTTANIGAFPMCANNLFVFNRDNFKDKL